MAQRVGRHSKETERGRSAEIPTEIPARGWKDIALRVKAETKDDHTVLAGAGVAFFLFVASIPAMAAAVSIYGIFAEPAQVASQLQDLLGGLPTEARQLIVRQLERLAGQSTGSLTWSLALSLVLAFWSASSGMAHVMEAVNLAYDEDEQRGFFARRGTALGLTVLFIVLATLTLFGVTVFGPYLESLNLNSAVGLTLTIAFWIVLALVLIAGLAVLYRYAPYRANPRWEWVTVGSVVAVVVWIGASVAFQFYTANFGSYDQTYGSLGAVVVMLFWLFITSFVVLLGAQINSEVEHQTRSDTTTGEPEPMGERGAQMADTLGQAQEL